MYTERPGGPRTPTSALPLSPLPLSPLPLRMCKERLSRRTSHSRRSTRSQSSPAKNGCTCANRAAPCVRAAARRGARRTPTAQRNAALRGGQRCRALRWDRRGATAAAAAAYLGSGARSTHGGTLSTHEGTRSTREGTGRACLDRLHLVRARAEPLLGVAREYSRGVLGVLTGVL